MKLVIDIPEEDYEMLVYTRNTRPCDLRESDKVILDGKPLNPMIENIKVEIEELKSCCDDDYDAFHIGRKEAYNNVLEIIDKNCGGDTDAVGD